jgi:hypothetical protein
MCLTLIRKRLALTLILTLAASIARPAAPPIPSGRLHLADYDAELRLPDGRVDVDTMAARLKEVGVTAYYWLIWHAPTDWDDLKLFLPKAAAERIQVWAYLVPPSEGSGSAGPPSQPFGLDFLRWGEEIARLSLQHTNLTGWIIDDFYANRALFTPAYIGQMQARAKQVQPALCFLPLMYFDELTPRFVEDYRAVIDGVVVAYLQDREEIERTSALLTDADVPAAAEIVFPWDTTSREGDFLGASQSTKVLPGDRHVIRFRERDNFTGPTSGYHFKQVLVNGTVVWEQDVAGGATDWRPVTVDVTKVVRAETNVLVTFRIMDKKGVSNFGARWSLSGLNGDGLRFGAEFQTPQTWTTARQGGFETGFGTPIKQGAGRFHVSFISMTAGDAQEFRLRHGEPVTAQRIADQFRLSLEAWKNGKCDGVVTYCLDKRQESQTFPLVRALLREYGVLGR